MFPENEWIVEVYWVCKSQVIVDSAGNIIDIRIDSVVKAMEAMEVPKEIFRSTFIEVLAIFHHFLKSELRR